MASLLSRGDFLGDSDRLLLSPHRSFFPTDSFDSLLAFNGGFSLPSSLSGSLTIPKISLDNRSWKPPWILTYLYVGIGNSLVQL